MSDTPPDAVAVTLLVGDRPVNSAVLRGGALVGLPAPVRVARANGEFQVTAGDATHPVADGVEVAVPRGEAEELRIRVAPVRERWFPRFSFTQGSLLLPFISVAVTLAVLQFNWLVTLLAPADAGGAAGVEPSPELIARLLRGQYSGAQQGVVAPETPRPKGGDKIESYYLQPGHAGPATHIGGGKNLGKRIRDGANAEPAAEAAPAPPAPLATLPDPGATAEPLPTPPEEDAEEESAEQIAQHMTEGFGFTDWYDTEDAREEAQEIRRELDLAKQVLALDPDDVGALSVLAYYEYLATDYKNARRTYERITELYPESAAGWNNLALTYKRTGEYVKEEGLYRLALSLEPDDDHALINLALCLAHQGRFDEALAIMEKVERIIPGDPYADLHRAKIYAAMGKEDKAYHFLQRSLSSMRKLDTLHNIEFRQDIRVDPALAQLRTEERFSKLLTRYYGDDPRGWWQRLGR